MAVQLRATILSNGAIWNAERRAIKFAMSQGVVVVAAAGNFADDLAHPTQDIVSPDTGPGEVRRIRNNCAVIPVEILGVIGVSGDRQPEAQVVVLELRLGRDPGGGAGRDDRSADDSRRAERAACCRRFNRASFYETILPGFRVFDCSVTPCAEYLYLQGTSMAAPHVTGVAALIESRYWAVIAGRVASMITQTADSTACRTRRRSRSLRSVPRSRTELRRCLRGWGRIQLVVWTWRGERAQRGHTRSVSNP